MWSQYIVGLTAPISVTTEDPFSDTLEGWLPRVTHNSITDDTIAKLVGGPLSPSPSGASPPTPSLERHP